MMQEIDEQLHSEVDLVVCPVGVGSFAHSVVQHYKQSGKTTKIMSVEPDTAPCIWKSIQLGQLTTVPNTQTAMTGLNCGTPSTISWPLLQAGLDASSTVCDLEAHNALQRLNQAGLAVGPCGAAPLASLLRLTDFDKERLGLNQNSTVVLLCTEGPRSYDMPLDVSIDDEVQLRQTMDKIGLGSKDSSRETAVAEYITAWLQYRDIDAHWVELIKGRPSVIGAVGGSGGDEFVVLNSRMDDAGLASDASVLVNGGRNAGAYGETKNGKLQRESTNTTIDLAEAMIALAKAKQQNPKET